MPRKWNKIKVNSKTGAVTFNDVLVEDPLLVNQIKEFAKLVEEKVTPPEVEIASETEEVEEEAPTEEEEDLEEEDVEEEE